jgi:7-dehydrocholesterol reductase
MGVELNPRLGQNWDFKLFYNGRSSILGWSLIDLSFIAYQYQTHGYVSKSILLSTLFHTIYILDFFYNESWYLRTIDIAHDHFGFYLAWGTTAFLPTFYTLQVQYLARNPTPLTTTQALSILTIGLSAYALFRSVNHQKDLVRRTHGNTHIWGRPATFITTKYTTSDGNSHQSLLITSGWWGVCRHANYLADLILSWAMCAPCGTRHVLPWSYLVFMGVLLVHRIRRDEGRCRAKYGVGWEEYVEKVRWKLVPGVW